MTPDQWSHVDDYLSKHFAAEDAGLQNAAQRIARENLPAISVSPVQGSFLTVLVKMVGARRVLEIGTLGGYSSIWLGRSLPADGKVISLEIDPRHAKIARENIAAAGLADRVEVRVGAALETLPQLATEMAGGAGAFDLVFIDADKQNNAAYLEWAIRLSRPGSVIVVDNVVRQGRIGDAGNKDADVIGTRRVLEMMGRDPRLMATAMQTVGSKGWDGFALAIVVGAGK